MKFSISMMALLLLMTGSLKAQMTTYQPQQDLPYYSNPEPAYLDLRYSIGFPMDGLKQQITNTSYNGWEGSLMFPIGRHFSLGFGVEYQDFYQKYPRSVYEYGNPETNISAVVSNSVQNIPILMKARYQFLKPGAAVEPYIGVGVGLNAVSYRQYLGEFTNFDDNSAKFALNGEAGLKIPLTRNRKFGLDIGAEYNFLPYNQFGINNMDFWAAKGGIFLGF
jgi:opacity protein-like surface antigen